MHMQPLSNLSRWTRVTHYHNERRPLRRMSSRKLQWFETLYTYAWIFNTGRGLSVCIRLPHNVGLIYDLGCSPEFSPARFIADHIAPRLSSYRDNSIAQCILSHPHADHIQEINAVIGHNDESPPLCPNLLTCPNDKDPATAVDFSRIENEDNRTLIEAYRQSYAKRCLPLQTIGTKVSCRVPNVEYGIYYMLPPAVDGVHVGDDQKYCNGLSIVLYLRHGHQTLLIPGDITPEVFTEVIWGSKRVEKRYTYFGGAPIEAPSDLHLRTSTQPTMGQLLSGRGLSVLVAPHHGLESCYSPDLFEAIKGNKPLINVISEKRHLGEADGKVDSRYQSAAGATGLSVDIEGEPSKCFSVSTRNDHHILVVFRGTDALPRVFLRRNVEELLSIT